MGQVYVPPSWRLRTARRRTCWRRVLEEAHESEISFVFSNWFFNSRLFLSSAPHREWRARTLSSISWTTRRRRRALQATRRPTARPSRHCGGALVSNPGGAGGVVLESPTHAHTRNGAEGARAQGHLSLCLCRASLALSPVLLPPPPPPSGVAPVIGFIHTTMLLIPTPTKGPQNTFAHSLLASLHLAAPPEQDAERTRHWCIAAAIVGRDERRRPLPHVRV